MTLEAACEEFVQALERSRFHADVALAATIRAQDTPVETTITYALRRRFGLNGTLDLEPERPRREP